MQLVQSDHDSNAVTDAGRDIGHRPSSQFIDRQTGRPIDWKETLDTKTGRYISYSPSSNVLHKPHFWHTGYFHNRRRMRNDYRLNGILPSFSQSTNFFPFLYLTRMGLTTRLHILRNLTFGVVGAAVALPYIGPVLNNSSVKTTIEDHVAVAPQIHSDPLPGRYYLIAPSAPKQAAPEQKPASSLNNGYVQNGVPAVKPAVPQRTPALTTEPPKANEYVQDSELAQRGYKLAVGVVRRYFNSPTYEKAVIRNAGLSGISPDEVMVKDTKARIQIYHSTDKPESLDVLVRKGETFRQAHNREYASWINKTADANGLGQETDVNSDGLRGDAGIVAGRTRIKYPDYSVRNAPSTPARHESKFQPLEGIARDGSGFALSYNSASDRLEIRKGIMNYNQNAAETSQFQTSRKESNLARARELMGQYVKGEEQRYSSGGVDYEHISAAAKDTADKSLLSGRNFRLALARELIEQDLQEEQAKHEKNKSRAAKQNDADFDYKKPLFRNSYEKRESNIPWLFGLRGSPESKQPESTAVQRDMFQDVYKTRKPSIPSWFGLRA